MPYAYETSLNKAKQYLQEGRYPEAAFEFYQAERQGSVEARRILAGKVNFQGQYDPKNEDSKTPDHPFRLALMHLMGLGVKRDDKEAYRILKQWLGDKEQLDTSQLEQNESLLQACDQLGCLLNDGRGVEPNHQEALAWFQLAAENNYPLAMANLGWMHLYGKQGKGGVVKKDQELGITWIRRGAEAGNVMAIYALGFAYSTVEGVLDTQAAIKCFRRAADVGYPPAMFGLGVMFQEGWKGEIGQDIQAALHWFNRAADAGLPAAMNALGDMYHQGRGVVRNDETAVDLFRQAAEADFPASMNNLGYMLREGLGIRRNDQEAVRWFQQAADAGDFYAMANLGFMYLKGRGITQNLSTALDWFQKAAAGKNGRAMFDLSKMYREGLAVPGGQYASNKLRAIYWCAKSLEINGSHKEFARDGMRALLGEDDENDEPTPEMLLARALLSKTAENLENVVKDGLRSNNAQVIFSHLITELQGEFSFASEASNQELKRLFNPNDSESLFHTLLTPLQRAELLTALILRRQETNDFLKESHKGEFSDIALLTALKNVPFEELEKKTFNQLACIILSHLEKDHPYFEYFWRLTEHLLLKIVNLDEDNKFLFATKIFNLTVAPKDQEELHLGLRGDLVSTPGFFGLYYRASEIINSGLDDDDEKMGSSQAAKELYQQALIDAQKQKLRKSQESYFERWRDSLQAIIVRIEKGNFWICRGQEIETSEGMKKVPEGVADIYDYFTTILKTSHSYDEKMQRIILPERTRQLFKKAKSIASEKMVDEKGGYRIRFHKSDEATRIYTLVYADSLEFPEGDIVFKPEPVLEHEADDEIDPAIPLLD